MSSTFKNLKYNNNALANVIKNGWEPFYSHQIYILKKHSSPNTIVSFNLRVQVQSKLVDF